MPLSSSKYPKVFEAIGPYRPGHGYVGGWKSTVYARCTEDAVYINIPMDPPNHGKTEICAFIEGFIGMASQIEFVVHHQIESSDGLVMNERTDRFLINDKWVELQVMGVFEFSDGKISAWRDYFDMAAFNA